MAWNRKDKSGGEQPSTAKVAKKENVDPDAQRQAAEAALKKKRQAMRLTPDEQQQEAELQEHLKKLDKKEWRKGKVLSPEEERALREALKANEALTPEQKRYALELDGFDKMAVQDAVRGGKLPDRKLDVNYEEREDLRNFGDR